MKQISVVLVVSILAFQWAQPVLCGPKTSRLGHTFGNHGGGRRLVVNLDVNKTILGGDKVQKLGVKDNLIGSLVTKDDPFFQHMFHTVHADDAGEYAPDEAELDKMAGLQERVEAAEKADDAEALKLAKKDLEMEKFRVAKRRYSMYVKNEPTKSAELLGDEKFKIAKSLADAPDSDDEQGFFVAFPKFMKWFMTSPEMANKWPYRAVVFRTFGTDAPEVKEYLNKILHGMQYDMADRFLEVLHDKKATREESRDYPYLVYADDKKPYSDGPHNFMQFQKDMEEAIEEHPKLRAGVVKILFVQDDFATWKKIDPRGGKTMVIDTSDPSSVQLFLDDNVCGPEVENHEYPYIVNVRDANDGFKMPPEETIRKYVDQVEPYDAATNENYLVDKVKNLLDGLQK